MSLEMINTEVEAMKNIAVNLGEKHVSGKLTGKLETIRSRLSDSHRFEVLLDDPSTWSLSEPGVNPWFTLGELQRANPHMVFVLFN